jgi:hypothetical protein
VQETVAVDTLGRQRTDTPLIAGLAALLVVYAAAAAPAARAAQPVLRQVADIPLPGAAARFDYQSFDPASRTLYIAHMGAGAVIVFDAAGRKVRAALDGFPGVTGVLFVPERGRLYASVTGGLLDQALARLGAGSGAQVAVIDTKSLATVAALPGGRFPDGLAYDPEHDKLFVSDEYGDAVLVFDAARDAPLGRIETGGEVGNVHYDPVARRIVAAVQSRGELAVIDPASDAVVGRIAVPGCDTPHGFLVLAAERRAFVSCEGNGRLMTVDLSARKVVATDGVGDEPDVLAYDPGVRRLYVASESGVVSVFAQAIRTRIPSPSIRPRMRCSFRSRTSAAGRCCASWHPRPKTRRRRRGAAYPRGPSRMGALRAKDPQAARGVIAASSPAMARRRSIRS